jgi:hypothetical protein
MQAKGQRIFSLIYSILSYNNNKQIETNSASDNEKKESDIYFFL